MRPLLHPTLVNGRSGDPALYIETLFEKHAILFDLGDITPLSPRKVQRLDHVFVSHTHIDHFIGFDRLLRLLVGREKTVALYGPSGFIDHVHHKLQAYLWNLVDRYVSDLAFVVTEIASSSESRIAQFRLRNAFAAEPIGTGAIVEKVICSQPAFRVSTAILEHRTPCLAFAIEEVAHVNVWKPRLAELGLPVGPWLRELKQAVLAGWPAHHLLRVPAGRGSSGTREMPLAALASVLTVTPGQKIAYVTDAADTASNRGAIISLVRNADLLFIEAAFMEADTGLAAERSHLTTAAAGTIARDAKVRRVEPFHFSSRYAGQEERMLNEVNAAFTCKCSQRAGMGGADPLYRGHFVASNAVQPRRCVNEGKTMQKSRSAEVEKQGLATADDVARILGNLDETKMLPILALRPTIADVEEASIWLGGDRDVFGPGEPLKGPRRPPDRQPRRSCPMPSTC
jgi:ribonuclease Z